MKKNESSSKKEKAQLNFTKYTRTYTYIDIVRLFLSSRHSAVQDSDIFSMKNTTWRRIPIFYTLRVVSETELTR